MNTNYNDIKDVDTLRKLLVKRDKEAARLSKALDDEKSRRKADKAADAKERKKLKREIKKKGSRTRTLTSEQSRLLSSLLSDIDSLNSSSD